MQYTRLKTRFNYTLLIALLIHLLGILAFGFSWANNLSTVNTVDVTLAHHQADEPVQKADFYAQIDQLGSGSAEQKQRLTQLQITAKNTQATVNQQRMTGEQTSKLSPLNTLLEEAQRLFEEETSSFEVILSVSSALTTPLNQPIAPRETTLDTASIAEKISALKSQISIRNQQITKAPKKRVISFMSTQSHQDAAYLENWRQKIVTVGNTHYPKAASAQKIYGRVRLLIAMRADGSVKSIEILESSGQEILDNSAIKIVKLAAPFDPFTAKMRKNTDVLEIIRTIEFEKTTQLY